MVNNVGKILNAGELKSIEHYKMPNKKPMSYVRRYQSDYIQSLDLKEEHRLTNILYVDTEGLSIEEWCMNYYGVQKFNESWMLNVSPNWKGVDITRDMINFFIAVIELFFDNCNRFTKMSWVLENGHGKDHLHAHIVFTLNTKKPGSGLHPNAPALHILNGAGRSPFTPFAFLLLVMEQGPLPTPLISSSTHRLIGSSTHRDYIRLLGG